MAKAPKKVPFGRLDELGVLVDVAEAGSLTAAAKRLSVPKSTVGRSIRRIEEDLGVSLVRRMARGPALTEPGRVLADLAAPHIAALRDVTSALGRSSSEAYGLLRVTMPADIAGYVVAPLLAGFLARHPCVRLEIAHGLRVVDLVREGFDLAIRASWPKPMPSSSLIAKRLGTLSMGLYAGATYAAQRELPKNLDELLDHGVVLFYPGEHNTFPYIGPKGRVELKIPGRVSGDDFFFTRGAIVAGVGIGMLPWFMASPELAAGRIVRVLPDHAPVAAQIYVVYPPAKPVPPKVTAFCSYMAEHAPRLITEPMR